MPAIVTHQLKSYNVKKIQDESSSTYQQKTTAAEHYRELLTQGHQATVVLQHHIPVESPLSHIQMLPFVPGEVHSNVLK